jgi:hypothetical protein
MKFRSEEDIDRDWELRLQYFKEERELEWQRIQKEREWNEELSRQQFMAFTAVALGSIFFLLCLIAALFVWYWMNSP